MSELRTSDAGLKLIMAYEGFRSESRKLPDGRWVIGYGHTKAAREGLKITETEAKAILSEFDLPPIEEALNQLLLVPVSQNEFDALVSFAFNIGIPQFESSDVLASINAGNKLKAAWAMESWRKARVGQRDMVVDPLVRRRADEKALFLKIDGPVPHASSSHFRPLVDIEETDRYRRQVQMAFQVPGNPANDQIDEEISTEAAARHVKDRLTRILGEEEDQHNVETAELETDLGRARDDDEKSVDDIRAAVSALAGTAAAEREVRGDLEVEEEPVDERDAEPETEAEEAEAPAEAEDKPVYTISAANDIEAEPKDEAPTAKTSPFDLIVPPSAQVETEDSDEAVSAANEEAAEETRVEEADIVEADETPASAEASVEEVSETDTVEEPEADKRVEALQTEDFDIVSEPLTVEDMDDIEEGEYKDERGRILIDDLRPSDVWLSEGREEDDETKEGPLETLLFGVLALVGAGLFTYGGAGEFGWFGMEREADTELMAYLPPFLMLLGGLVFVVMAYYCFKAIFPGKKKEG
ncbi:lysozyme [Henriciella sp.]|uniref:lysozyme n=1 Tax=Henriciella sp. TaxID=1968823 RepID=UPI0025BBB154|nr:lysozyme [Henriciella sp.]